MPSEQAKDPGGLETRTVNLQAPGFFVALYPSVPSTGWVGSASSGR